MSDLKALKQEILQLTRRYSQEARRHSDHFIARFDPASIR